MDSDLAWVNGKSARQSWCYADAFKCSKKYWEPFTILLCWLNVGWAKFNVPLDTIQVISETMFYMSDDPTNSVKALKEGG